MIYVCAKTKVEETVRSTGAARLVTLLSERGDFVRPKTIAATNHLFMTMNDIPALQDGLVIPGRHHVEDLITFVRSWDQKQPLVINCFAGVSRSTAAAYIAVAALAPTRDEMELARTLRRLSPSATPNPMLVRHADEILGREGRMIAAIAAIGRGADAFEGEPFALDIDAKS